MSKKKQGFWKTFKESYPELIMILLLSALTVLNICSVYGGTYLLLRPFRFSIPTTILVYLSVLAVARILFSIYVKVRRTTGLQRLPVSSEEITELGLNNPVDYIYEVSQRTTWNIGFVEYLHAFLMAPVSLANMVFSYLTEEYFCVFPFYVENTKITPTMKRTIELFNQHYDKKICDAVFLTLLEVARDYPNSKEDTLEAWNTLEQRRVSATQ